MMPRTVRGRHKNPKNTHFAGPLSAAYGTRRAQESKKHIFCATTVCRVWYAATQLTSTDIIREAEQSTPQSMKNKQKHKIATFAKKWQIHYTRHPSYTYLLTHGTS